MPLSPLSSAPGAPIFRRLLLSFLFITAVPVLALGVWIYQLAWENAEREFPEKHGLLARNVALPLHEYLDKHIDMLILHADRIEDYFDSRDRDYLIHLLEDALEFYPAFRAITVWQQHQSGSRQFIAGVGRGHNGEWETFDALPPLDLPDHFAIGPNPDVKLGRAVSGMFHSPRDGLPVVFLGGSHLEAGKPRIVLIGELDIREIDALRADIRFGTLGHCAIVDQNGIVVAHPNRDWMASLKNLSDLDIVKKLQAGESGVTQFFSAHLQQQMVAGYAPVPEFGWGIMIPQPVSEIRSQVNNYTLRHLVLLLGGIVVAWAISIYLAMWITRPINRLAIASLALDDRSAPPAFDPVSPTAPREVNQLNLAVNRLINRLNDRHHQINSIVNHSPLLFMVANDQGKIVFATGKMLPALYRPLADILHATIHQLFAPRIDTIELMEKLHKGEQRWVTMAQDDSVVMDFWFSPTLGADGALESVIIVGSDVSDSHLAARTAQFLADNRRLLQRALSAEEDERQRLARELHDQLGQDLAATRNYATAIRQTLDDFGSLPAAAQTAVQTIDSYSAQILNIIARLQDNIRGMLQRLRPEALDELGLVGAIREMLDTLRPLVEHVELNTREDIEHYFTNPQLKIALYRITQECLTNIAKHAEASHIEVTLAVEHTDDADTAQVQLTIWDNGRGFDPGSISAGFGLMGMRERIAAVGGQLHVVSEPGEGCTISATAPLRR